MLKIIAIILISFAAIGCLAEVESSPDPDGAGGAAACTHAACRLGPIRCDADDECGVGVCSDDGVCVASEE